MKALSILAVLTIAIASLIGCTTPTSTPVPTNTSAPTATSTVATPTPAISATATPTSPQPTATSGAPQILKLGFHSAMTGSGAGWGVAFYRGSILAIDEVNKAGGVVVSGQRYMLDEVAYDDKYLPNEGVNIANKLIFDDKVKFVMSTGGSGPTLATLPIYNDNKVMAFDGPSFSDQALAPKYPLTFRTSTTAAYYYKPLVEAWRKAYPEETKKVAIINPNDALGWTVQKQGQTVWPNAGAEIVSDTLYQGGTTDFSSVLTGILSKKPTFIDFGPSYPADQIAMLQQVRDLGYKGPIGTASYMVPEDMVKGVKAEYLEGFTFSYFAFHVPEATPRQKAFYDAYIKLYGAPFMPAAILTYAGFQPLVLAMQKANSLDPVKVAPVLETLTWDSILGPAKWGGKEVFGIDHELLAPVHTSQVKNGKVVLFAAHTPIVYSAK